MSLPLDAYLRARSDRCAHGFHLTTQHPELCSCTEGGEWATFVRAVRQAADAQGVVSQTRVRPLIASIPAKHRGLLYRRARKAGLLVEAGSEPSTDTAGRNGDKDQRVYKLGVAA
jgi:hypothetical protein